MRSGLIYPAFAVILCLLFFSGCTQTGQENTDILSGGQNEIKSSADALFETGMSEYSSGNYRTAEEKFAEAQGLYAGTGLESDAKKAENRSYISFRSYAEYSLNETSAYDELMTKVPGISDEEISGWLSNSAQKIVSDGETLYFSDTASDYLYANYEILQKMEGIMDFDFVSRDVFSGRMPDSDSPYFNPVSYQGTEKFVIPKDYLKGNGTVRIWMPLPVATESQTDVSAANLSYSEYIAYGPVTDGQIGYVYYEIPAEKVEGDLIISADVAFKSYEQGYYVDPEKVLPYNKSNPEYILYTKSDRNIEINDEISKKAREIVGDETNPYLQAAMIYNYIIDTYPYSHVPHLSLDTVEPKTAESTYMYNTGHGDCGTQSMLFSAMCRSLGIPARATGGYQMILSDTPGTHFWAMYYIEGYGWIPCDPTVAEAADWVDMTDEKRQEFKEYFAHNLDNTRFVIQKDVDAEMTPEIPDDAVVTRLVRQIPAVIYDGSDVDIDLYASDGFSVELRTV